MKTIYMGKIAQKHPDGIIGSLCAIGCETLYGLSYIFTKQETVCASEFALLGWRFFIAVMVMSLCILFGFIKIDLKGKSKKPLLLVAFCNPCIYFLAETIGISNTTASESGIFPVQYCNFQNRCESHIIFYWNIDSSFHFSRCIVAKGNFDNLSGCRCGYHHRGSLCCKCKTSKRSNLKEMKKIEG